MMNEEKKPSNDQEALLLKAKSDALRLLSFRPRSVEELRRRLKLKKVSDPVVQEVIDSFKRQGLLDDAKFAKLYASSSVSMRPVGRRNLRQDLKMKGISAPVIEDALKDLEDYDEKEAACKLVLGRFERMTGISTEKKKARIYGFLKRRGFSDETIYGVFDKLLNKS